MGRKATFHKEACRNYVNNTLVSDVANAQHPGQSSYWKAAGPHAILQEIAAD